jgi:hypothetical protein
MRTTSLAAAAALLALTGAAVGIGAGAHRAGAATAAGAGKAWVNPQVPHPGADQIWWVPTFTQAEQMARVTGRPIFAVGHVSGWQGY